MLLGFMDFLSKNWLWLTLGLVIIICICILLCTDTKGKKDGKMQINEYKGNKGGDAEAQDAPAELEAPAAPAEAEAEPEAATEQPVEPAEPAAAPAQEPAMSGEEGAAPAEEAELPSAPEEAELPAGEEEKAEVEFAAPDEDEENLNEEDHSDVVVKSAKKGESVTTRYRIVYDRESMTWVIRKDGSTRAFRRVKTKKEALEIAKELSKKQDVSVSVHKRDGKFQKKN